MNIDKHIKKKTFQDGRDDKNSLKYNDKYPLMGRKREEEEEKKTQNKLAQCCLISLMDTLTYMF